MVLETAYYSKQPISEIYSLNVKAIRKLRKLIEQDRELEAKKMKAMMGGK